MPVGVAHSVIGRQVKQNGPLNSYGNYHGNQSGPFRAEVVGRVGRCNVCSAGWLLRGLAFLVTGTSLCIGRYAAKILVALRSDKQSVRAQALKFFHHKTDGDLAGWALGGLVVAAFAFLGVSLVLSGLHSDGEL